jgi:enoyl-CoA hydratase
MDGSYDGLGVELRGQTLWISLDNPPVNAATPGMRASLARIFGDVARDDAVRCVVLTGAGDTFSAGGDLNRMVASLDDRSDWLQAMPAHRQIVLDILNCDKPIIARINGHAIGLGATLAVLCDISIMSETAKIADNHVKVGLVAGDGGALLWPHLIGWAVAKRYLLTGEPLTGREAMDIGLISRAVPRERLDEEVQSWVDKLANGASQAIYGTKRAINMTLRQQAETFMDAHLGLETMSQLTKDHREAVLAFRDKRKPQFKGN